MIPQESRGPTGRVRSWRTGRESRRAKAWSLLGRSEPPSNRRMGPTRRGWLRCAAGVVVLVGLAVAAQAYRQATDPERVRLAARNYLQTLVGGQVTVQQGRFSLLEGIELTGVSVAEPSPAADGATSAGGPAAPRQAALSCPELRLRQNPWAALRGRLAADEIVAQRPTLSIYRHSDTGQYNVAELFRIPTEGAPDIGADLPTIRLHNAHLQLGRLEGNSRTVVEDLTLSIVATPRPDGHAYELHWAGGARQRSAGRTLLDLRARTATDLEGGLPWLTVEGAMLVAAARLEGAVQWCELLGLTGQVQVRDFCVQAGSDEGPAPRATVELRDATVSIPLDDEEGKAPPDRRYLRFTNVDGRLETGETDARARFTGLLHGAACQLDVQFNGAADKPLTVADVGFSGQIKAKGLPLPAPDDPDAPGEARFVARWQKLRDFYRDYDPHGTVNLEIMVAKEPGADAVVKLERAALESLDCDASYRFFPYRLRGLAGAVEFRPEGVRLVELTGEHAGGRVVVNGTIEQPRWTSAATLHITGRNIPIDRDLHDALGERYRSIWDRFELNGSADIDVDMDRPWSDSEQSAPWQTMVEARFLDLDAQFGDFFCYPVEHITGRLRIDPQAFTVTDLTGRCGAGRVVFNGSANMDGDRAGDLDLDLAANDLAFDDRLYEALPAEARDLLRRFDPRGAFDLAGRLSLDPPTGRIVYDLEASLRGAAFTYQDLPVPIDSVTGTIRVTPRRISVTDLAGHWGDTRIAAEGSFDTSGAEPATNVQIDCSNLRLDDRLRELLPENVGELWNNVEVAGCVDTSTQFSQVGLGDGRRVEHTTRVTARGVSATYAPLPLPLTNVHGTVTVGQDRVGFADLTGQAGEGTFTMAGELARQPDALSGRLNMSVRGMSFTDQLRAALPWKLRRAWNNVRPEGRFDLDVPRLDVWVPASEAAARWDFDAALSLADAGFDFGIKAADITGTVRASGWVDQAGLSFAGQVGLDHAELNGHRVTDVTGRFIRTPDPGTLVLDDLDGECYGGAITGSATVDQATSPPRYSCEATLHEVRLDELLGARRPPEAGPVDVGGWTDARLYLSGAVGDPQSTHGGGQVSITKARMFTLPMLLNILGALELNAPDPAHDAAQTVSAEFFVLGSDVELRDILLADNTVAMLGTGRLQREAWGLDLRLVAVSPRRWFKLPIVTELVEGTARELVEIEVQGPLEGPRITATPLRGVSRAVETLLARRRQMLAAERN